MALPPRWSQGAYEALSQRYRALEPLLNLLDTEPYGGSPANGRSRSALNKAIRAEIRKFRQGPQYPAASNWLKYYLGKLEGWMSWKGTLMGERKVLSEVRGFKGLVNSIIENRREI